jgi:lambda family phage portal protein
MLGKLQNALTPSAWRARAAENDARSAQAEAEAAYYRQVQASITNGVGYNTEASGTRLDTPWGGRDTYRGEIRDQGHENAAELCDRARTLEDRNWLASSTLDRAVENVIGTTFRIEPRSKNQEWNRAVRDWWADWAHTTTCDIRGRESFGGLLRLFYRGKLRDGDCGMVLAETQQGSPRLQLVERDRIESQYNGSGFVTPQGTRIQEGIEYDGKGRDIRFFVRYQDNLRATKYQPIDARDFVFIHRRTRGSSLRGMTAFQGGFTLFDQIVGYLDAVVVAARIGASQALIGKRKNPQQVVEALMKQRQSTGQTSPTLYPIQPGMINIIGLDEELTAFNPSQPAQNFPDAIATFGRFVGLRFGLTLEQVLLDFSRTNYSSSRAARLQADSTASIEQEDTATSAVSRIYRWAVSKAAKSGEIKVKPPEDSWAHEWIPQARPPVDPIKEMTAADIAINKLGVDCRSYFAASLGYVFSDLCMQQKEDLRLMREAGMPIVITTTGDPVAQAARAEADAYGVAARAALITPNAEDEKAFRAKYGFPVMPPQVVESWNTDGTRKPITLQPDEQPKPATPPGDTKPDLTNDENQNADQQQD